LVGDYVDIGGHPTWVDERGRWAETVLLLHGGLSHSDLLLDAIGPAVAERYRLVAFDRRGHGRTADTPDPFHYDDMVTETIGVLERVVGDQAHLVGWSDGGIIALLVALRQPELAGKVVAIGTNYHYEGIHPVPIDAASPVMAEIAASYGERSPDGPDHFSEVLNKSLTMIATEPMLTTEDLKQIDVPTLVVSGDDELVRLDHTCSMYEALPAGQLAVVPGASHALPIEKPAEVARLILEFLAADGPPQTFMPVRRPPTTA
jgi:pimeloyl-ACP methyl ester carboxylesterase